MLFVFVMFHVEHNFKNAFLLKINVKNHFLKLNMEIKMIYK